MAAAAPWLVPMLASGALQFISQNDVARRQNRLQAAMDEYQRSKARESTAATERYLDTLRPESRAADVREERALAQQGLERSVGASSAFQTPNDYAGVMTPDFAGVRSVGRKVNDDRLKRAIEQLSTSGAVGGIGIRDATRFGRSASDVDAANSASRYVGSAYERDIANVRPNPLLGFASQLLSGYGTAVAGGAKFPRPSAPKPAGLTVAPNAGFDIL